ncbi:MAG: DUF2071 domain-containing protein [Verrucomicrobiales bacterium]|nr:DUF2071 domain-containing protein [Verrucomicrobiales bacterium]
METTHDLTGYNAGPNRVQFTTQQGTIAAKSRMQSVWGDPLLLADWAEPVFLHFTIDPEILQPWVPFPLDIRRGKAYITLVAFTMRDMRFRCGGQYTKWMTGPIATHSFLNLRTYVKRDNEPGIHFICEWLNSRLATKLGPVTFGLPYRYAKLHYQHNYNIHRFEGNIECEEKAVTYRAEAEETDRWQACDRGSDDEFLLERYTAYTKIKRRKGFFRVWHEAWPQKRLKNVDIINLSLLEDAPGGRDWVKHLKFIGGNVSTGAKDVWMGRPHFF